MTYVFEPAELPTVAVYGTDARFPISRVFCIGKNYAAHAREMGVDPDAEPPSIFTKPANSVVDAAAADDVTLPYPPMTTNLHHEVELVVAIERGGRNIRVEDALDHVFGFGVGFDMTRRDMQTRAKEKKHPWAMSKGFDCAAPMGPLHPRSNWDRHHTSSIAASVDGVGRQSGDLAEMVWPVADIIRVLSDHLELLPGDLIFTGTPAGVGPVERGERVVGEIDGLTSVGFTLS